MHLIRGGCPQSHTGQGFSSCIFSCQRAKKSIVLGHFPFQFELWFFLIWSWSIPAGASKIRCSTRVFAVSKTAATDHSRHESTKCEQHSKSGSRASGSWVRIPPYPPRSRQQSVFRLLAFLFAQMKPPANISRAQTPHHRPPLRLYTVGDRPPLRLYSEGDETACTRNVCESYASTA